MSGTTAIRFLVFLQVPFLFAAIRDPGAPLRRIETTLVETVSGGDNILHDDRIAPETVRAIAAHLASRPPGDGSRIDSIHPIPNRSTYLVVSSRSGRSADFGLRLLVVDGVEDTYRLIDSSPGMGDSWFLRPVLFADADATLILADTGVEYSWGLAAWAYRRGQLNDLGPLPVAAAAPENTGDPLPHATVFRSGGGYEVRFDTDLVWEPGGRHETDLPRIDGAPIVLRTGDDRWNLVVPDEEAARDPMLRGIVDRIARTKDRLLLVFSTPRADPDGSLSRSLDRHEWQAEEKLPMIRVELRDATSTLVRHFEIDDGPTLILFHGGAEAARWVGPIDAATLDRWLADPDSVPLHPEHP